MPLIICEFDYEKAKNIAAIVQSVFVCMAVIIGGAWTLFTYRVLNLRKKSEAEYREIQRKSELQPLINITIRANYYANPSGNGYLVSALVLVENVGNRDTALHFPNTKRPFNVDRVFFDNTGQIQIVNVGQMGIPFGDGSKDLSRGSIVRAGAKVELPFIFVAVQPGVYFLSFSIFPDVDKQTQSSIINITDETKIMWTGRSYLVIASMLAPATSEKS